MSYTETKEKLEKDNIESLIKNLEIRYIKYFL